MMSRKWKNLAVAGGVVLVGATVVYLPYRIVAGKQIQLQHREDAIPPGRQNRGAYGNSGSRDCGIDKEYYENLRKQHEQRAKKE